MTFLLFFESLAKAYCAFIILVTKVLFLVLVFCALPIIIVCVWYENKTFFIKYGEKKDEIKR